MDELLREVAELPCANTPLYAAHQLDRLDYEPEHPAEGETLCFSECHACRARVRAIALLKTHKDEAITDAMNTDEILPIMLRLLCPICGELHVDEGEWATKPHHTHVCQACGHEWRPAIVPTTGVRFLPGHQNERPVPMRAALLQDRLVTFARGLVAEPFDSNADDEVRNAIVQCKRDIGRVLLRALGVEP